MRLGWMWRRSKPSTTALPRLIGSSAVSSFRMVDLPEPEGPTRKTNSPLSTRKETPLMAWVPLSYILLTLVKRIIVFPAIPMVKLHSF